MKKSAKKFLAILTASLMLVSVFSGNVFSAEEASDIVDEVIIIDEENNEISGQQEFSAEISDEMVKFGNYAYKCTTATAKPGGVNSEGWFFRSGNGAGGLSRTLDISSFTENGAVRFWIYVEDMATVHNWGGSQVQFGSNGWDKNTYVWNDWHKQIVNDGWNEIILPLSSNSSVDTTKMTWFFIKMSKVNYATTVYLDNIRVTKDCVPESNEVVLATADWSKEITNQAGYAEPSDEKAAVGKKSYKATTGNNGNNNWFIRGTLPSKDISTITNNGTSGALRFKIYVEDITTVANWNGSQVQLGSGGWDNNVHVWNNFSRQITQNGWNDIVLKFTPTNKIGTPNPSKTTYFSIRTGSVSYVTTVYIDDIRITSTSEVRSDISVLNEELGETAFVDCNTSISTEKAKVGQKSYKANPKNTEWVLRSSGSPGGLSRKYNITSITNNGTSGALRFWIYVENATDVANWGDTQVQYGYFWDNNVCKWSFGNQITKNGWNEIVLPFANAAKMGTPDFTNMHYFFIKIGKHYDTVIYIDDIRVTASSANTEDVKLVNEELGFNLSGTDFCASLTTEQAIEGVKSYKGKPGVAGQSDNWVIRGNLPRQYSLSELSLNGTSGALKFSVYVEDISIKDTWYSESSKIFIQAALGTGSDYFNNYFIWNFEDQITKSGWNEVVLPLVDADKLGNVSADKLTYFWIRIGRIASSTIYVDNIRFENRKSGDINADYSINAMDLTALRTYLLTSAALDSFVDVTGDGESNIIDLVRLKKMLANV